MNDNLPKLFAFIKLQVAVKAALYRNEPINVDCVTANAYDFRLGKTPDASTTLLALRYLGCFNNERRDAGAFIRDTLSVIEYAHRRADPTVSILSQIELRKYVVAFRNYDRVKRGRITKWKLLPAKNM